ncbi:MAG: ABC transporter permease [Anaerolineales bacterium]|nr:ABC transporter permease [Anaerolineales bacterium]
MLNSAIQAAIIINILAATIRISTPLLLAALGELVTERSGILNLGVEGTMLMGAWIGFLVTYKTDSVTLGILGAMLAGGLMGLLMVFMSVVLKVDQTVTGLSLNLFSSGATYFWYKVVFEAFREANADLPTIRTLETVNIRLLSDLPYVGEIFFSHKIITYIAFAIAPMVYYFLYKTKYGLRIRSVGENPRAVDMKGLSVSQLQLFSVVFGGVMAGLAGSFLTVGSSSRFLPDITAGRGWLALVIVIAGNWLPWRIVIATLIFSFLDAVQLQLQGVGIQVPYQILLALPYVFAILALAASRARSLAPAWLGKPYERE